MDIKKLSPMNNLILGEGREWGYKYNTIYVGVFM